MTLKALTIQLQKQKQMRRDERRDTPKGGER